MLAPRTLPVEFRAWNEHWGAPNGRRLPRALLTTVRRAVDDLPAGAAWLVGPFGFQHNSSTRAYEYPWTYHALNPRPGYRVLEIGGAFSGLQFALARSGCEVHNVDPFVDYGSGDYCGRPLRRFEGLNRALRTDVVLHQGTLLDCAIEGTFDAIYSVSTLEHIPLSLLPETLARARSLLKPGGQIILTVDLFLDLQPFCSRERNRWGTNVSIRMISELLGMRLLHGEKAELYGYSDFATDHILSDLERFMTNHSYPQLAQLVVFGT